MSGVLVVDYRHYRLSITGWQLHNITLVWSSFAVNLGVKARLPLAASALALDTSKF